MAGELEETGVGAADGGELGELGGEVPEEDEFTAGELVATFFVSCPAASPPVHPANKITSAYDVMA